MWRQLLRLLVVTSFGRNSLSPLQAGLQKLLLAMVCALFFGWTLAVSLTNGPHAGSIPAAFIASLVMVCSSVGSGFLLLLTVADGDTAYRRQGSLWPLGRSARWLLRYGVRVIILLILLCFGLPMTLALAHATGISSVLLCFSLLLGLLAGFGASSTPIVPNSLARLATCIALAVAQALLLEQALQTNDKRTMYVYLAVLWAILVMATAAGIVTYFIKPRRLQPKQSSWAGLSVSWTVSPGNWFTAKLGRKPQLFTSLAMALILSVTLGASIWLRHMVNLADDGWLLFGAVLASSATAEWRAATRRHKPAEVVGLHGPRYFVTSQLGFAWLAGLVIGLPVAVVALLGSPNPLVTVCLFVTLQTGASMVGLAVGALFAAAPDDAGTQFFATIAAITVLLTTAKYAAGQVRDGYLQAAVWLLLAGIMLTSTYVIEIIRRRRYGWL